MFGHKANEVTYILQGFGGSHNSFLAWFQIGSGIRGQEETKDTKSAESKPADQKPADTAAPKEQSSTTDHTMRLGGQSIGYKATASTTLLYDAGHMMYLRDDSLTKLKQNISSFIDRSAK